jgi:putative hydrolase of the HAD superfamily
MAQELGVPISQFALQWSQLSAKRLKGDFPTLEATLENMCAELDVNVDADRIKRASSIRYDFFRRTVTPRSDSLDTLSTLKNMGYGTAMITDCSAETAVVWRESQFVPLVDVPLLSCEVRMTKPDPRIYLLACRRLGTPADRCLYVGDGGSDELSGAAQLGMTPVLIRTPEEDIDDRISEEWNGIRISAVSEILEHVE